MKINLCLFKNYETNKKCEKREKEKKNVYKISTTDGIVWNDAMEMDIA